jgi:hypothetical protein
MNDLRTTVADRLAALQREAALGEQRMAALDREAAALRETLLRIAGATQVLQEVLAGAAAPDAEDALPRIGSAANRAG